MYIGDLDLTLAINQDIFGSLLTTFDVSCIIDLCLNSNCQIKDLQGRSKTVAREAVA